MQNMQGKPATDARRSSGHARLQAQQQSAQLAAVDGAVVVRVKGCEDAVGRCAAELALGIQQAAVPAARGGLRQCPADQDTRLGSKDQQASAEVLAAP